MKRRVFIVDKFIVSRKVEFGRKYTTEGSSPKIRNFQFGGGGDEEQSLMTS